MTANRNLLCFGGAARTIIFELLCVFSKEIPIGKLHKGLLTLEPPENSIGQDMTEKGPKIGQIIDSNVAIPTKLFGDAQRCTELQGVARWSRDFVQSDNPHKFRREFQDRAENVHKILSQTQRS